MSRSGSRPASTPSVVFNDSFQMDSSSVREQLSRAENSAARSRPTSRPPIALCQVIHVRSGQVEHEIRDGIRVLARSPPELGVGQDIKARPDLPRIVVQQADTSHVHQRRAEISLHGRDDKLKMRRGSRACRFEILTLEL